MNKKIIIAIDGYSSCGKSTMAKDLAKKLGYIYVDTGAMYRAVTLYCIKNGIIVNRQLDEEKLRAEINKISVGFVYNPVRNRNETVLNGVNIEDEIRGMKVSNWVSQVSAVAEVRKAMVEQQRLMGKDKGIVMDGRDIGTVVFPNAELKIFMTAMPEIRAQRRYDELSVKKEDIHFDEVLENIKSRDNYDMNRKESPLRKGDDAIELDNSFITPKEQLEWVLARVAEIVAE